MAQAPQPPHRPTPPPSAQGSAAGQAAGDRRGITKTGEEPHPATDDSAATIGVKGTPIEDGERDPDTIAEEQRRRSAEIEGMGVEAWKAAHDEREARARVEGTKKLENHKAP